MTTIRQWLRDTLDACTCDVDSAAACWVHDPPVDEPWPVPARAELRAALAELAEVPDFPPWQAS